MIFPDIQHNCESVQNLNGRNLNTNNTEWLSIAQEK